MESIIEKLGKASVTVEKDYHSSEKEYNKLTVVEEEGTFKTYLSRKPVPVGIELTNREYWICFSGVLESITFDYLKFKRDYASGKALENNSIITRHILDRNIERIKIALKAISEEEIDDNAIIERTIKNRNVTSNKIAKENILTEHFAKKSVITAILADYTITAIKLADNSVTTRSIVNENVTQEKLSIGIQSLINNLSKTATFAGIAIPTTNPGKPDGSVFYITNGKGTYSNFGGIVVIEDEIAILYYDTNWHKITTGIASQKKLIELNEKVNSLALGKFYGYFPNSSSLPVDITISGYAYVGLDSPYKIWNFNGKSWSDSGTFIDMNDADEEDITRNADGKLQFKDKEYGDGMGYVILRKNKSFAEQVTQENTIYKIIYDFDLSGAEITIPDGCILQFDGGSLRNGILLGNFCVKASNSKIFYSISFIGDVQNTLVANLEWFVQNWSAKMDYKLDATNELQEAFDSGIIHWLINENRYYYITKTIVITKTIFIDTTLRNNYSTSSNSLGDRVYLQEGSIYSDKEVTLIKYIHKGMNGNFHNTHIYLSGLRLHTTKDFTDITDESKNTPILYIEASPDLPKLQADGIDLDVAISSKARRAGFNFTGVEIYAKSQGILFLNLRGNIFRTYYGMYFHFDSPYWFNGINIDCTTTCTFGSRDSIVGNGVIIKGFHQTFNQPNEFNAEKAYFNFPNSYAYFYGLVWDMGHTNNNSSSPRIALKCKISKNILAPTSYDGEVNLSRSVMPSTNFYSNEINIVENKIGENIISLYNNGAYFYINYDESSINNKSFNTFINEGKLVDINYLTNGISTTNINKGGPNINYEVAAVTYSLCKADVTEENSEDGIYTIKTVIKIGSLTPSPSTARSVNLLLEVNTAQFYMPGSVVLVNIYNRSNDIIESVEKQNGTDDNFYKTKSLLYSINKIEFINTVQFKADSKVSYVSIPRVRVSLLNVSLRNQFNNMFVAEPFPVKGSNFVSIFSKSKKKPLYYVDSRGWIDSEGNPASALTTGKFNDKPLASTGIKVGFQYYCTDRKTIESVSYGIMIYHKGNDIWIDALGRIVE